MKNNKEAKKKKITNKNLTTEEIMEEALKPSITNPVRYVFEKEVLQTSGIRSILKAGGKKDLDKTVSFTKEQQMALLDSVSDSLLELTDTSVKQLKNKINSGGMKKLDVINHLRAVQLLTEIQKNIKPKVSMEQEETGLDGITKRYKVVN